MDDTGKRPAHRATERGAPPALPNNAAPPTPIAARHTWRPPPAGDARARAPARRNPCSTNYPTQLNKRSQVLTPPPLWVARIWPKSRETWSSSARAQLNSAECGSVEFCPTSARIWPIPIQIRPKLLSFNVYTIRSNIGQSVLLGQGHNVWRPWEQLGRVCAHIPSDIGRGRPKFAQVRWIPRRNDRVLHTLGQKVYPTSPEFERFLPNFGLIRPGFD